MQRPPHRSLSNGLHRCHFPGTINALGLHVCVQVCVSERQIEREGGREIEISLKVSQKDDKTNKGFEHSVLFNVFNVYILLITKRKITCESFGQVSENTCTKIHLIKIISLIKTGNILH